MRNQPNITQLKNYLNIPQVKTLLQEIALPESEVEQWLGRLMLLIDVPFQNIIADTRLIPTESLRFFYVDPSWLNALMDGALSIGSNTSVDMAFTEVMGEVVKAAGAGVGAQIRAGLLGIEPDNTPGVLPDPSKLMSGLLFRSSIVSNWPALHIIPTYADSSTSTVPLRFEKIGGDMILVIFPGIPQSIVIQQPSQGLTFGVQDGESKSKFNIYLRGIGTGNFNPGKEILVNGEPNPVSFDITDSSFFRPGGSQVLSLSTIAGTLSAGMQAVGALTGNLSPSEFALQLVKTPDEVTFSNTLN